MRRNDREVDDTVEIAKILDQCDACRLAMIDENRPYIVPMNFGYSQGDGSVTLYFHSANQGRKIDILKAKSDVCVEMDCGHELIVGSTDCSHSMAYESLIGNGIAEFIEEIEEKRLALTQIMKKYTSRDHFEFDEKMLSRLSVFKIIVIDFTGKRRSK